MRSLVQITCAECGNSFQRERWYVANRAIKHPGGWVCCSCSTAARNRARAFPIGTEVPDDRSGYSRIKTTDGWMRRNRYVLEQALGRKLLPKEVAHHKNGIKPDDRPENLEVKETGQHTSDHHSGVRRGEIARINIRDGIRLKQAKTRLNPELVATIRQRAAGGETQRRIAADFRVTPNLISKIVRHQLWKD